MAKKKKNKSDKSDKSDKSNQDTGYRNRLKIEQMIIRTIIAGPKEPAQYLLGHVSEENFLSEMGIEAFKFIDKQVQRKGEVPSWNTLLNSRRIDLDNQRIWRAYTNKPLKTLKEVKELVEEEHLDLRNRKYQQFLQDEVRRYNDKEKKFDLDEAQQRWLDFYDKQETVPDLIESVVGIGEKGNPKDYREWLSERKETPYIRTGFNQWDRFNDGFRKGNLVILSAYTGVGKTALAMNIGLHMAFEGAKACHVNFEMAEEEMLDRMMSNIAKMKYGKFKNPNEYISQKEKAELEELWKDINKTLRKKQACWHARCPQASLTMPQLLNLLKPLQYDVITIDMINLLRGIDEEDQWRKMSNAARYAKFFARNNDCIVIILSQANKIGETRYSRGIVEHADVHWNLIKETEKKENIYEVVTEKARGQVPQNFELNADLSIMHFWDQEKGRDRRGEEGGKRRKTRRK